MYKYSIRIPDWRTCHSVMAAYSYKGVEYEFVNTQIELLDELKCPICLELVSDPVQTSCGHLFCGECIEGIQECPVDRELFTTTPDLFNNRRVRNFKVKCPNRRGGCQWQGNLGDIDNHTAADCDCDQLVVCYNDGCLAKIERRHLVEHMYHECPQRVYNCPFCDEEDTYLSVTTTHFTVCEGIRLSCPAGCGRRGLVRGDMAQHLSTDCPNELVPCMFATAGCQQIVKRKDLHQHLQDKELHLDTFVSRYLSLSHHYQDLLYGSTPNIPLPLRRWLQNTPTCYPRPPWVVEVRGFQKKKKKNEVWFSDPVYSHFGGYKMCLRVDANGQFATRVSVYVYLMRGGNDDNLKWPFKGTIKVSLLNQLEDGQHHTGLLWSDYDDVPERVCGRVTVGEKAGRGCGLSQFMSHQELCYPASRNCEYLKDDTLFFRVDRFKPKLD